MWEKKMVWVVTVWLKETDGDGTELNWTSPSEELYAETVEEAEKLKESLLNGEDAFYGDLVEDVLISDGMQEREFLKLSCAREHSQGQAQPVHLDP